MNRKAIIISNPGEPEEENYCAGVLRDVENYRRFLLSPIGGLWRESEIELMPKPTPSAIRRKLDAISSHDYSVIIFSGHGYYCTNRNSSILCLHDDEEIDSDELRHATKKQTLILDCCRESYPSTRTVVMDAMKIAKSMPFLDHEECRRYFNKQIHECGDGLTVMYSCDIDELSGDDSRRGGYYSSTLIEISEEWARGNTVDTRKEFAILSVASVHSQAIPIVRRLAAPREQNPQVEKTRTGPYFPFSVVA